MSSVLLPESHHTSSLMKMSTVIQVIIYFWVATHLFSRRQRIQRQSQHKTKSLPLQVWHDRRRADSLILHVQMNAASNRDTLQSADGGCRFSFNTVSFIDFFFLLLSWVLRDMEECLQIVPHKRMYMHCYCQWHPRYNHICTPLSSARKPASASKEFAGSLFANMFFP